MRLTVRILGTSRAERALGAYLTPLRKAACPIRRDAAAQEKNSSGSFASANKILSSLPHDEFEMLAPHMTSEVYEQGAILIEAGDEIDFVYFPNNGMISLLSFLKDGSAVETATVGREGVVGAMAGLGLHTSLVRAIVQLPLEATKISVSRFQGAVSRSDMVRNLCIRYNEVLGRY